MQKNKILTAIYIDKSHPKTDGKCRISIRITFDRVRRYYSTPHTLSISEFDNTMKANARQPFKDIALELQAYENKASAIIKEMPVFTWEIFEKRFYSQKILNDSISNAFETFINALKSNHQIGTAVSYGCAKKSLQNFDNGIRFTDVTAEFLRKYEKWMLDNNKSVNTISMYLRHLRTLFNNAIADDSIPKEIYPFGKKHYEIPTGNNIKKALGLQEIGLIYNHKIKKESTAAMARDFWLFIYLCNGMNMKDLCLLKWKNFKEDVLEFQRAKTKRTKRKVEAIRVSVTKDVSRIISTYGNKDQSPENYIFPILCKGVTPERERQLIQQITHLVNDHMKEIALQLGIKSKTSTQCARHSFSTILQRSGVSTSFISEALGHTNVITTQNYLAGFEDKEKMSAVKALTAFKKIK